MGNILSLLFPDTESRLIAQALSRPATFAEIADATGLTYEQVEDLAVKMSQSGAVGRYPQPRDKVKLHGAVIELRDATVVYPQAPPELPHLWERLITEELANVMPEWLQSDAPPALRVVPIETTVPSQSLILDIDSARKIVREAELITATPCACRYQALKVGKGHDCSAPHDLNLCLQINKFAQNQIERGFAERLTNEEALRRLELAEDAGLVHQVRNNVKKDMLLCNCCSCCCTGLWMLDKFGFEFNTKSRFQVEFDPSTCKGCGKCVKRCQFKAITIDKSVPAAQRVAMVNVDKCYGCGYCVATCPSQSLQLKEVRPREYVRTT